MGTPFHHSGRWRSDAQPALRVDSDLVLIPASVVDRQDRLVVDLPPPDFTCSKTTGRGSHPLRSRGTPVSVAIVFDASRSMRRALPDARAAVRPLPHCARPTTNGPDRLQRPRRVERGFGARRRKSVLCAWPRTEARGGTSLLDALVLAVHLRSQRVRAAPQRAILVFTDGERA